MNESWEQGKDCKKFLNCIPSRRSSVVFYGRFGSFSPVGNFPCDADIDCGFLTYSVFHLGERCWIEVVRVMFAPGLITGWTLILV